MGREIRRVALDFDWPLDKTWKGFLNPHFKPCPASETNACHGGYNPAGKWLDAIVRFLALIGEQAVEEPYADKLRERGTTFPHPYLQEFAQAPRTEVPHDVMLRIREIEDSATRQRELYRYMRQNPPQLLSFGGEEMVQLLTGLAGGKKPDPPFGGSGFGWEIQKTLMKAAGIDPDGKWGQCKVCDGHGIDPAVREIYENWKPEPPPAGEGWQLWETVGEGAPITPVFPTAEGLIDWMSQPCEKSARDGRGFFPDLPWGQGYKREHAVAFVRGTGWAPSGAIIDGRFMGGVEAMATMQAEKEKTDASEP